nr:MAG: DNA packaging protein [Bacteriophage sp.]
MTDFEDDLPEQSQDELDKIAEQEKKDAEFLERLSNMSNEDLAKLLLNNSLKQLLVTINKGWATASDINTARQFLKDNNIGIVPTRSNAAGALQKKLKERAAAAKGGTHHSVSDLDNVGIDDFIQRH